MYVNERDQINYHGFLRALREMNQVSQAAVGKGICTVSGMNRFENGNRIAEKLMRDRLTARLGISGEKYEDYLQPKEYVRWEHRLRIVKAIEKKDFATAKRELSAYRDLKGLNKINVQFVEAMNYMILSLEGASNEVLLDSIEKAVKCTVPSVSKALAGEHLLSDQEVNLVAESMRLCPARKAIRDEKRWRISEYEKLITYMNNSSWEKLQKAKVYPKVVYYILQLILSGDSDETQYRHGLELCHNAIELLRDSCRLHYFIELTEMRRAIVERISRHKLEVAEKIKLEKMLEENDAWEKVLKELYEEYDVSPYTSDFCYLYYETECHNMVEVIETRRNMLGLSRVKLGEGICTDKTIVRFEREGRNPNIDLVRLLFERMGLCAEYRRARVVTNDVRGIQLSIELANYVNDYNYEGMKQCISDLKDILVMSIPFNRQEIMRNENLLLFREGKIGKEKFHELTIEELECSLPVKVLGKDTKRYLTRNEISCICDLAFQANGTDSKVCISVIEEICESIRKEKFEYSKVIVYEIIGGRLASHYGNSGKYSESSIISGCLLKECLTNRRANVLAVNFYSIFWNDKMQYYTKKNNYIYEKEVLTKCVLLSGLVRKKNLQTFFQQKKDEM